MSDIICTNASANDNSLALLCVVPAVSTDNLMHQVEIAPDATFTHSFGTGLECPAGTTLLDDPPARGMATGGRRAAGRGAGFGRLPQLTGLSQMIGLALGSPEFQRR